MNPKESPPPYTSGAEVPLNSPLKGGHYPPLPSSPTFDPPYVTQYQPVAQQQPPTAITTHVNVSTARARGSCPVCQSTSWTGSYSCCAWLLCIFCFPCGIICCCCMRKKKCNKCGFTVG